MHLFCLEIDLHLKCIYMVLMGAKKTNLPSRLSLLIFPVQSWCNTGGNNGHNRRCGQLLSFFVDIIEGITLYGHNRQLD